MTFQPWRKAFLVIGAITLFVASFVRQTTGSPRPRVSLPTDWSHRHIVFSRPASLPQAWALQREPRYWQQVMRRSIATRFGKNLSVLPTASEDALEKSLRAPERLPIHRDWAESLGPGASTGNSTYSQFRLNSHLTSAPPAKAAQIMSSSPQMSRELQEHQESCSVVNESRISGAVGQQTNSQVAPRND
jgi:hypothetical protein